MSLKQAAVQIYRTAATQAPEAKPQADTPSYSVRISPLAENLANAKPAKNPATRRKN